MDLMLKRRLLLSQQNAKTIGGLPILIDNAYLKTGNSLITVFETDPNYFVTGFFDTGSTSSKNYTYNYTLKPDAAYCYLKLYNDITKTSVDYWGCGRPANGLPYEGTINTSGRFVVFSIYKPMAGSMFMYDNTNQRYVFKGKNVT